MPSLTTWLMRLAYGAGGIASVGIALLYFFQEKLLYVPRIPGIPEEYYNVTPDKYGLQYEDVFLRSSDGTELHAWFLHLRSWTPGFMAQRPVIMFFQENAGSMAFRLPFLRLMIHRLQCPVFALSYRGYGQSKGRPNEQGIQRDAEAALQHVLGRPDVDARRVVVFGRSLGGAVAVHLVARAQDKIRALVVENTFTGVEDMVQRVVPPLGYLIGAGKPLNWLVTNKWANVKEIGSIRSVPLLMLVSLKDEMVPCQQMFALHQAQRAQHCELVQIADAHHMDAYDVAPELYWGELKSFFDKYVEPLVL